MTDPEAGASAEVILPTKCTDWNLNVDAESGKHFWWNGVYSISIWENSLVVPKHISREELTDFEVWQGFIAYQLKAVYKLCPICKGPEQAEDLSVCCYCGSTVHTECSVTASPEQIAWKPANRGFEPFLRVCKECEDINQPPHRPIEEEPTPARRAAKRALSIATEYPPHISQELHRILKKCDATTLSVTDDVAALRRIQELLRDYFQPHGSHELLQKQRMPSKAGGIGVVARAAIPRFTVVGIYPGYEDPLSGEQAKMGRPGPKYSLVDLNCADYFNNVFAELDLTFTPFINEPNPAEESNVAWIQETTRPEGRLSVMTVRDISAGEELLIGYGPLYPRTYPYRYDAYAYHLVDGYADPPCFALWHWKSLEEKDSEFVCYCGFDKDTDSYSYWETEEELKALEKKHGAPPGAT